MCIRDRCEGGARYVEIQVEQLPAGDEILDSDMRSLQRKMYESCVDVYKRQEYHFTADPHINNWQHCNAAIIFNNKTSENHVVDVYKRQDSPNDFLHEKA